MSSFLFLYKRFNKRATRLYSYETTGDICHFFDHIIHLVQSNGKMYIDHFLLVFDYSLLPVIARDLTNVFCVKQYRMISGMEQITTPMEMNCCDFALETTTVAPFSPK